MKNKNIRSVPVDPDEVTPQALYLSRRKFIKGMGLVALGALHMPGAVASELDRQPWQPNEPA